MTLLLGRTDTATETARGSRGRHEHTEALEAYMLLEAEPEPAFDDITRLAALICNTPVALLAFLAPDSLHFPSAFGIEIDHAPRGLPAFEKTILGADVYEVADARVDPAYKPGILLGGRSFGFYAGATITTPSGAAIGCLSVFDTTPGRLTDRQVEGLAALARQIVTRLERNSRIRQMERAARARQRAESALAVEQDFVSAILDTVAALVAVYDPEGRIVRFNRACETTCGYDLASLAGRFAWESIIPAEDVPAAIAQFERLRAGAFPAAFENQWLHRDGSRRAIAWSATALLDANGRLAFLIATGIDVTAERAAESTVRVLTRQSDSILESVGDGIYALDLHGRVTVINPAAAQMLGYKPHELLGQRLHDLAHHTHPDGSPYPAATCAIARTLVNRDTIRIANEVFWRKDGTSFPVEYVACPQIAATDDGKEGAAIGVVVAFTDTTERRALDRMKDEFVSTVSHELRTPLTSIRGALGLIAGGALESRPDKVLQMLHIAIGNTDRLTRLVNDILELERIGSGKAELQCALCPVDDLLRRAADLQATGAAKAGIRFHIHGLGVTVWADAERILQTLTNLISNAIKFSPPGSAIALSARVLDDSEAEILVKDEGRGIPEDKLERIFERFQQVDASDSRAMGGTGLGLAICRGILQQHGGRIWATSTLGLGSTFHLILPTRPASNLR